MIRITSNFRGLEQANAQNVSFVHEYIGSDGGAIEFIRKCLRSGSVIVDTDQRKLMLACLLRWVLPFADFRLVSVDLILRRPTTPTGRVKARLRAILLWRVDRFALYFKNLRGYESYYGIGLDRAVYVPFKVNGWERLAARKRGSADGAYVLCAGRTLRDIETFVEALRPTWCAVAAGARIAGRAPRSRL